MDKLPDFLKEQNLKDIFETLIESNFSNLQDIVNKGDAKLLNSSFQVFCNYALNFYNTQSINTHILSMNKNFMIFCIKNKIRFNNNNEDNDNSFSLKPSENLRNQDIQHQRQVQFQSQVESKKNEFDDLMTLKKPPSPDFGEAIKDQPIKNISGLLNNIIADRDKDILQIQKMFPPPPPSQDPIKYINIGEEINIKHNISLINGNGNGNGNKKVSWSDDDNNINNNNNDI